MAATSSWGLGTHRMTADISSSTPVTSTSTESPIKAKSFGMVDGSTMSSPSNGNGTTPVSPSPAASAVRTNHSTNTNTAGGTASNEAERVPASAGEVGAVEQGEEEASEVAAGTSSDSEGEDEDEDGAGGEGAEATTTPKAAAIAEENLEVKSEGEGGGGAAKGNPVKEQEERLSEPTAGVKVEAATEDVPSKVNERTKTEAMEAAEGTKPQEELAKRKPAQSRERTDLAPANGHVPVGSTNGSSGNPVVAAATAAPAAARNASVSPPPRQEVDEHAARASDAATAALAAALASATSRNSPSPRPARSSPPSKSPMTCQSERGTAGGVGRGSGVRKPAVMVFRVPQGRDLQQAISEGDLERVLSEARFVPERSSPAWGEAGTLPPPIPLPTVPMPCMKGEFKLDATTGLYRCNGFWAMNKADLRSSDKNRASPFEFKMVERGDFPHTGKYQGHFFVRQPPKPVTKVEEKDLHIVFVKNSEGGWNMEGRGRNVYGDFTITGRLGSDMHLEVYRAYQKIPKTHHRRASGAASAATPGKRPAGGGFAATPAVPGPYRGKHVAPTALGGAELANGSVSKVKDGNTPAPTSRRVSRTPSKLINDIGNDGTTHLTHGLRRCVTVLNHLRAVRGKSEWFNEPVDHVGLNLPEYTTIIKRPMDLGTVKTKLESGQYKNTVEFVGDVRLVFSNACYYNSDQTSAVHMAARHLLHMFETKMEELGPNLDDPPAKRKKSGGGGGSSSNSNHHYSNSPANGGGMYTDSDDSSEEEMFDRDRKRKSSEGGSAAGGGGGGSTTKKPRAPSSAKPSPQPKAEPVAAAPIPATLPATSAAAVANPEHHQQVLMMQRQIIEMQEQLAKMQGGAVVPQPNTHTPPSQPTSGSKRKAKAGNGKAGAGSSKGGAKSAKGGGGGARKGSGGGRAAPNPAKVAADKAAKAAAKARKNAEEKKRKAEEASRAAEALAAAQNPLTFDEKKTLSVAINNLDQGNLTRVVEIIQSRMPLGSSDEEIELDIDSMDNLTLRDLQAFIKEVSDKGGARRGGGGVDSDSDGEQW